MYRFFTAALLLLLSPPVVESAPCDNFGYTGTGEEYSFSKLSVVGFAASVSYVEIPAGTYFLDPSLNMRAVSHCCTILTLLACSSVRRRTLSYDRSRQRGSIRRRS